MIWDFTIFQWGGLLLIALLIVQLIFNIIKQVLQLRLDHKWHNLTEQQLKLAESSILKQHKDMKNSWSGYRKFKIYSKIKDCQNVTTFYLTPHDDQPIPRYNPGQHLTVQLKPHNQKKIVRCYSLSDTKGKDNIYTITVKKLTNPNGKASSLLHDEYSIGDLIDIKAPKGKFYLKKNSQKPVVLLANGVGITPLLAMLNFLYQKQPQREVILFYGVRNGDHFIKQDDLRNMKYKHEKFSLFIFYSQPKENECETKDYDVKGYVTSELVLQSLRDKYSFEDLDSLHEFEYYVCGSSAMMTEMLNGLKAWQIPSNQINYEAFGAFSLNKKPKSIDPNKSNISIEFKKSGKKLNWGHESNLLELSQNKQVPIDCGCCCGECGTCEVAIISGEVEYPETQPETEIKDGHCLMCIAVPKGPLILDA